MADQKIPATMSSVIAKRDALIAARADVAQTEKEVKGYTAKLAKRKTALAGAEAEYNQEVAEFEKATGKK